MSATWHWKLDRLLLPKPGKWKVNCVALKTYRVQFSSDPQNAVTQVSLHQDQEGPNILVVASDQLSFRNQRIEKGFQCEFFTFHSPEDFPREDFPREIEQSIFGFLELKNPQTWKLNDAPLLGGRLPQNIHPLHLLEEHSLPEEHRKKTFAPEQRICAWQGDHPLVDIAAPGHYLLSSLNSEKVKLTIFNMDAFSLLQSAHSYSRLHPLPLLGQAKAPSKTGHDIFPHSRFYAGLQGFCLRPPSRWTVTGWKLKQGREVILGKTRSGLGEISSPEDALIHVKWQESAPKFCKPKMGLLKNNDTFILYLDDPPPQFPQALLKSDFPNRYRRIKIEYSDEEETYFLKCDPPTDLWGWELLPNVITQTKEGNDG